MYTSEQIFTELSRKFTREAIIKCAKNDLETPYGFLVCFIRDNYGVTEGQADEIAQGLINFFNLK